MPWWNCHKLWAVLKVITALNYNYFLIFKSNLKSILWFKTKEVLHIIFHNKYSDEVVSHWYIGIVPMASFSKNWQFSQKKEKARKIEQYLSSYMNNFSPSLKSSRALLSHFQLYMFTSRKATDLIIFSYFNTCLKYLVSLLLVNRGSSH